MQTFCIIGTDTEIGKTYACCAIMRYLAELNQQVTTLKPIASGLVSCEYGSLNEDVYQLFKASNYRLEFAQINPFGFSRAIAPHLAAKLENKELSVKAILHKMGPILNSVTPHSNILIEGVGGLMVPLNDQEEYIDLLKAWNYPIILVVGMKLGCLSHTRLSVEVLRHHKLNLCGWIANQIDSQMDNYAENLDYLSNKLDVPLLATIGNHGQLQASQHFKGLFPCH